MTKRDRLNDNMKNTINNNKSVSKSETGYDIIMIDPRKLEDHPLQDSTYGNIEARADFDSFYTSIQVNGIVEPLLIRKLDNGNLGIVAGHGRKYCAIKTNILKVPCILKEFKTEDDVTLAFDLTNTDRKQMTSTQLALICQREYDIYQRKRENGEIPEFAGLRMSEIVAKKLSSFGIGSEKKVRNLMKLNPLITELKSMVDNKTLSEERARAFAKLDTKEQKLMYDALADNMNLIKASEINEYKIALEDNVSSNEIKVNKLTKELEDKEKLLLASNNKDNSKDNKEFVLYKDITDKELLKLKKDSTDKDSLLHTLQEKVDSSKKIDVTQSPEYLKLLTESSARLKERREENKKLKNLKVAEFKDETVEVLQKHVSEIMISLSSLQEYLLHLKENDLFLPEHSEQIEKIQTFVDLFEN